MRYSKKAQSEVSPIGASGGMVIAVIVLVLSMIAVGYLIWGPPKIFSYLPEFNNKNISVSGSEKIRYVIPSDKIQYYDGENWIDISGKEITMNEKVLDKNYLVKQFRDSYYNGLREEPKSIVLSSKGSWSMIDQYSFNSISKGNLYITLHIYNARENYQYTLDGDNNLIPPSKYSGGFFASIINKFSSDPRDKDKEIYSNEGKIKTDAIAWRDSVIIKPIDINYKNEQGTVFSHKYCAKKFDKIYLIIYLDDSTEVETC